MDNGFYKLGFDLALQQCGIKEAGGPTSKHMHELARLLKMGPGAVEEMGASAKKRFDEMYEPVGRWLDRRNLGKTPAEFLNRTKVPEGMKSLHNFESMTPEARTQAAMNFPEADLVRFQRSVLKNPPPLKPIRKAGYGGRTLDLDRFPGRANHEQWAKLQRDDLRSMSLKPTSS